MFFDLGETCHRFFVVVGHETARTCVPLAHKGKETEVNCTERFLEHFDSDSEIYDFQVPARSSSDFEREMFYQGLFFFFLNDRFLDRARRMDR